MSTIVSLGNNLQALQDRILHADAALEKAIKEVLEEQQDLISKVNDGMLRVAEHMDKHRIALHQIIGMEEPND